MTAPARSAPARARRRLAATAALGPRPLRVAVGVVVVGGCVALTAGFHGLPRLSEVEEQLHLPEPSQEAIGLLGARAALAQGARDDPSRKVGLSACVWGPNAEKVLTDTANDYWLMAVRESGLNASGVSLYGCSVPKVPLSLVKRVQALSHEKVHTYNFQGSYMWEYYRQVLPTPVWNAIMKDFPGYNSTQGDKGQTEARNWVIDFAKANFTDRDLLKITDADQTWKRLGPYDISEPGKYHNTRAAPIIAGDTGEKYHEYLTEFDESYWRGMAGSSFTLCPGGDDAWSMRFYEAILAGSIPVIKSEEYDIGAPKLWALWDIPYKYYVLTSGDELIYRQDWVDENLELFVKYQTFRQGDLRPPHTEEDSELVREHADDAGTTPER